MHVAREVMSDPWRDALVRWVTDTTALVVVAAVVLVHAAGEGGHEISNQAWLPPENTFSTVMRASRDW